MEPSDKTDPTPEVSEGAVAFTDWLWSRRRPIGYTRTAIGNQVDRLAVRPAVEAAESSVIMDNEGEVRILERECDDLRARLQAAEQRAETAEREQTRIALEQPAVEANIKLVNELAAAESALAEARGALKFIALQGCTSDSPSATEDRCCIDTQDCITEWCLPCYAEVHAHSAALKETEDED